YSSLLTTRLQKLLDSGIVCRNCTTDANRGALILRENSRKVIPAGRACIVRSDGLQECHAPNNALVLNVIGIGSKVSLVGLVRGINPFVTVPAHCADPISAAVAG